MSFGDPLVFLAYIIKRPNRYGKKNDSDNLKQKEV